MPACAQNMGGLCATPWEMERESQLASSAEIRDMLLDAVDSAASAFRFENSGACVAFQCPCSPGNVHTATPNKAHSYLICTRTTDVLPGGLSAGQEVWLGPGNTLGVCVCVRVCACIVFCVCVFVFVYVSVFCVHICVCVWKWLLYAQLQQLSQLLTPPLPTSLNPPHTLPPDWVCVCVYVHVCSHTCAHM